MGLFAETPKTKGGLNNNNLKINKTATVLIELFLKYGEKIILTELLSVQETAFFFTVYIVCCLWQYVQILREPHHPSAVWFH